MKDTYKLRDLCVYLRKTDKWKNSRNIFFCYKKQVVIIMGTFRKRSP